MRRTGRPTSPRPAAAALLAAVALATTAPARAGEPALLAAAELRVGVERLAKLCVERTALIEPTRARDEIGRERVRVMGALATLRGDTGLSARRRGQVLRLSDGVSAFVERVDGVPPGLGASGWTEVYRDSEVLAAQMSFVSTGLSGDSGDDARATLVDLLTRAAATALRVGKLNFAAAVGPASKTIEVDLQQALGEFSAALAAISTRQLSDQRMRDDLELARQQWVLFSATLNSAGRVKDSRHLPHLATTADRIAQSLLAIAQRAMRPAASGAEPPSRRA